MIGSIIGAVGGIGSSIYGGITSAKYMEKAEEEMRNQRAENAARYNARIGENYINTAEAQSLLAASRKAADDMMRGAEARHAVMGGDRRVVDAAREQAASMVNSTIEGLSQQSQARRDAIESEYANNEAELSNKAIGMYTGQAQQASNAASQGMQAGMSAASALDNMFSSLKKKN